MAWVYILKGSSGRHYIGSAVDLQESLPNIDAVIPTRRNGSESIWKLLQAKKWQRYKKPETSKKA
jgi:hypothetical protein